MISTYVAGIPELVQPGVTGWLVPAGAVGPLVDAMAEALTAEPPVLEEMGRAGAKRVAEQHNVYTEAGKLVELFSQRDSILPRENHDAKPATTQRDIMIAS